MLHWARPHTATRPRAHGAELTPTSETALQAEANSPLHAEQLRLLVEVNAHELAHMWFGDLVTMEWWDDLWLNESFASWMGDKAAATAFPEFRTAVLSVEGTERAMRIDARATSRAIRRPVNTLDNLLQSADVLAYQKGQAVLGMVESWVGQESFRKGVNQYLKEIAGEDFTAKDFRTWYATSTALEMLAGVSFRNARESKQELKRALESVAGKLGNTVTMCRKCYVNPVVVDAFLDTLLATPGASVVGIASIEGLVGHGAIPSYTASKHGVIGLWRALAGRFAGAHRLAAAQMLGL